MHMVLPLDTSGHKGTAWCGPSAVAMLVGRPLREVHSRFSRVLQRPYTEVEGVYTEDALLALHSYGYKGQRIDLIARYPELTAGPTLPRFLRERRGEELYTPMLLSLPRHFILAHGARLFDNSTPRGALAPAFPRPNRCVSEAWLIKKL